MKPATIWLSPLPDMCQGCGQPFNGVMYDAALPPGGPWGNICQTCFDRGGCRTGPGFGQKYELQDVDTQSGVTDKMWVCVEGSSNG